MDHNYMFQAAPKAVQTRAKKSLYREHEESKEDAALAKTQAAQPLNLMFDRRVARGSTYAPSKRTQPLAAPAFRPMPVAQAKETHSSVGGRGRKEAQHPLPPSSAAPPDDVDFMRVATPEPVAGRSHCTVQTDTYLEDLRRQRRAAEHDFATQTDPENDRPTQPLFIPRSSGEDAATEVLANDLFDFDLEVQPTLDVLVEKTLEQALMAVCEEEEQKELDAHRAEFEQHKNAKLVHVQQQVARDERRENERVRRAKQEAERLASEKSLAERRAAALAAQRMQSALEADVLQKLSDAGAFQDPVRKEVDEVYMPQLLRATAGTLARYAQANKTVDSMLFEAIRAQQSATDAVFLARDKEEESQWHDHFLDPLTNPAPVVGVVARARRVGQGEERANEAATQLPKPSASAGSAVASTSTPQSRARLAVDLVLAERERLRLAAVKRLRDIVTIQALGRGLIARRKVAVRFARRKLESLRAAMSPAELLKSLKPSLGVTVEARAGAAAAAAAAAESKEEEKYAAASAAEGVYVLALERSGPASQATLVRGDRIVSINGVVVSSADALTPDGLRAAKINAGDTVELSLVRALDGRTEIVQAEVGVDAEDAEGHDHAAVRALRAAAEFDECACPWIGEDEAAEMLSKLPAKLGATLGEHKDGAQLTKIGADSAAARANLPEGAIIAAAGGDDVEDSKQFTAIIKELQAGDIIEFVLLDAVSSERRTQKVELGGGAKKQTVESVRSLRRIAGLPVFGEQE